MIIKSVYLKEGLFERKIEFSPTVTFIHSKNNSCGKTTLLRVMLYGLGYNVPNTKRIKFQNCEVIITVECEKLGIVSLCRNDASSIVLKMAILKIPMFCLNSNKSCILNFLVLTIGIFFPISSVHFMLIRKKDGLC